MQPISLTRASIVSPIVSFLDRAGAPVQEIMASAGVPAWVFTDPEAVIPTSSAPRLLAEASRLQGIDNLGLLAGQEARIESLGIYGQLIVRASTLRAALEASVREHSTYTSNSRMWLVTRDDQVEFCQAFTRKFDPFDPGWQQANHYILMLMLAIVRLGAGPDWRPAEVRVQTGAAAALRDAASLSGAQLTFGQPSTAIIVPLALLDTPLQRSTPDLSNENIAAWRASAPAREFVGAIVQVVETLSWGGYPEIRLTAEVVGMSVRTLQRHLAGAGFTHESVVGQVRFATAAALLGESDAKILDIALDLGYSDHAHFTRAFRRWAGCSPQEFRRRSRPDANALAV